MTFEQYMLHEGFRDYITKFFQSGKTNQIVQFAKDKFTSIKNDLLQKDWYGTPLNTRKIHASSQLEKNVQELNIILQKFREIDTKVCDYFFHKCVNEVILPILNKEVIGRATIGFIVAWSIHLIALYGLYSYKKDGTNKRTEDRVYSAEVQQDINTLKNIVQRYNTEKKKEGQ